MNQLYIKDQAQNAKRFRPLKIRFSKNPLSVCQQYVFIDTFLQHFKKIGKVVLAIR